MDDANTEQMVGGIRLRTKISQWMCPLILHDFVQFFKLQFGQCYVPSHLFYTWIREHQCQHQISWALFRMELFLFQRRLAGLDRFFEFPKKISTDNNNSTYSLILMHEFDKNIRQNPLLYHPNVLKIMLHLHSKNWLEPLNGPKHKNHWSSWSLISLTYSLIYSFLLFLIYSVIKSGNSNIRLVFISSYCLFFKKTRFLDESRMKNAVQKVHGLSLWLKELINARRFLYVWMCYHDLL